MGFIDKIKGAASKSPDKVEAAIDKAGDLFDERTGGKHAQHTDTAQQKAGEFLTGRESGAADDGAGNGEGPPPAAPSS